MTATTPINFPQTLLRSAASMIRMGWDREACAARLGSDAAFHAGLAFDRDLLLRACLLDDAHKSLAAFKRAEEERQLRGWDLLAAVVGPVRVLSVVKRLHRDAAIEARCEAAAARASVY